MIPNIGPMELGVVLIIALVVFGPKRLPELGSSLGRGIRGLRRAVDGEDEEPRIEAGKVETEPVREVRA